MLGAQLDSRLLVGGNSAEHLDNTEPSFGGSYHGTPAGMCSKVSISAEPSSAGVLHAGGGSDRNHVGRQISGPATDKCTQPFTKGGQR